MMLKRHHRRRGLGVLVSVASDSAVCENCGMIGRREDFVPVEEAAGQDLFRCPDCASELSREARPG